MLAQEKLNECRTTGRNCADFRRLSATERRVFYRFRRTGFDSHGVCLLGDRIILPEPLNCGLLGREIWHMILHNVFVVRYSGRNCWPAI
jgi:hypothetical protein